METQIAGSIARMDGSTSQDAIFKDVLAYKEVLAHIMKTCVPEYKDCTIPQIIGYIEPNPQVGQVGLHPDETNPPKIQGMSTESTTTTEERVVYDVRFSAVAPGEDGKIGLIINIEAQSKLLPGQKVVVVEDLISTGGSVLEVVNVLREAGAQVLGVVSIFTYGMAKGLKRLAEAQVKHVSLTNFDVIAQVAAEEHYIRPQDVARLISFRDNPSDESWIGGTK